MVEQNTVNIDKIFQGLPICCLILSSQLELVAATDAYFAITHTNANEILHRNVFDVFPDNPNLEGENASKSLSFSLQEVLRTKSPHTMPALRYDIKLPKQEGGKFVARWWKITNSPILNSDGEIIYIVNVVEDISEILDKIESAEEALNNTN